MAIVEVVPHQFRAVVGDRVSDPRNKGVDIPEIPLVFVVNDPSGAHSPGYIRPEIPYVRLPVWFLSLALWLVRNRRLGRWLGVFCCLVSIAAIISVTLALNAAICSSKLTGPGGDLWWRLPWLSVLAVS
jgi:hypothetical protein